MSGVDNNNTITRQMKCILCDITKPQAEFMDLQCGQNTFKAKFEYSDNTTRSCKTCRLTDTAEQITIKEDAKEIQYLRSVIIEEVNQNNDEGLLNHIVNIIMQNKDYSNMTESDLDDADDPEDAAEEEVVNEDKSSTD